MRAAADVDGVRLVVEVHRERKVRDELIVECRVHERLVEIQHLGWAAEGKRQGRVGKVSEISRRTENGRNGFLSLDGPNGLKTSAYQAERGILVARKAANSEVDA